PTPAGLFSDECVKGLHEFHDALQKIFGTDDALKQKAGASNVRGGNKRFSAAMAVDGDPATYWATDDGVTNATLLVDLGGPKTFNVIRTEEEISLGQRVQSYKVEAFIDGGWKEICSGTTIGHRKLDRFPPVTAARVRLTILAARACPTISSFGVHYDSVSTPESFLPENALKEIKRGTRSPRTG